MIVGIKNAGKLIGVSIVVFCAVTVCTMFLNFYKDITPLESQITAPEAKMFYDAQVSTAKVVCGVTGGCLMLTSAVMLIFYVKRYIDVRKKELGVLKALGVSENRTAAGFWVFGAGVFIGAAAGFCAAYIIMPYFYGVQNEDKILPQMTVGFHFELFLYLVVLPAAAGAALSVLYARRKLKAPVMRLIRDIPYAKKKRVKKSRKSPKANVSFLSDLKSSVLRSKKILTFFIVFASFCFSAMTQMSFSMKELSSVMMAIMIMTIGIILACTTLLLAINTVIGGNAKTLAVMNAFGYSQKECGGTVLGVYRIPAYIGFAVGTAYQYFLLRIMVDIVFGDIGDIPEYRFDFKAMLVSLALFLLFYEAVMYFYSRKISRVSVKEIMCD